MLAHLSSTIQLRFVVHGLIAENLWFNLFKLNRWVVEHSIVFVHIIIILSNVFVNVSNMICFGRISWRIQFMRRDYCVLCFHSVFGPFHLFICLFMVKLKKKKKYLELFEKKVIIFGLCQLNCVFSFHQHWFYLW